MPRGPENGAASPVARSTATFSYSVPIRQRSRGFPAWCICSTSCSTLSIGVACALSRKSVIEAGYVSQGYPLWQDDGTSGRAARRERRLDLLVALARQREAAKDEECGQHERGRDGAVE